ncbi:MAG TPA: adenylate/guanylate cyclase domain-containing protein [Casimicrobiaceae bacterium]
MNAASPQTLTFLFTDIEGSTPLWDSRPDAMRAATERHNALLREAITAHGGNAFRVVGDAFCVAFSNATSATLAAVDAQHALCAQAWGDAPIHVRMGLHSGAVDTAEDEIFRGPSLARAARVMSAAHGDQILATAATVALLDRKLPAGGELRDLGDHTLRGFARPERLYQLVLPGLRSEFPPIRTQEALRTNLPQALTSFIGRTEALAQVREQVRQSRMVTLIGPGGTGKTRLALEAAGELIDAFPDGVWLIELAPLADAALVPHAIAAALGARAEGDVQPMTLVEATLRGKRALLLLDNCEHVVDEAAKIVQTLLRALPQLHLLASSREALGAEGEVVYRVPSLTMPTPDGSAIAGVTASEAGELFVERALAVAPAFALTKKNAEAVAQVCRRLDGIPLAIELAAARLTALSVEELARRIDDRFRLLTGGLRTALPRQRTLRAMVDWSYDLLSADEQLVLNTLAVFAGGFSLDAAERICASDASRETTVFDAIAHLVAKSLLLAEQQQETDTRYRLLETIRQYAGEKLAESGQADSARRRHFTYFLDLAETAADALRGPLALEWLDRLEAEHDNLRAALDWSGDTAPADYARLAGALREFWDTRGHFTEGWARLERALTSHQARDDTRFNVLIGAGVLAYRLDYTQRSDDILGEAITLARRLGNARSEAEATLFQAYDRSWQGADAVEPLALRGQALAQSAGDLPIEGFALLMLGRAARLRGQYAKARTLFLDSARLYDDARCVVGTPLAIQHAGACALDQLDFMAARPLLDDALVQHRRFGNVHDAATTLGLLGRLALNEHQLDEARAQSEESLRVFRALHDLNCGAHAAEIHATVLCAMGEAAAALPHAESAATTYRELGFPHSLAHALCTLGRVHAALGDVDAARRALFDGLIAQQRADRDIALPGLLEAIAGMHPAAPVAPQLLGSAAELREQWNVAVFPAERAEYESLHAAVHAKHAAADFDRAVATGRALTRDAAIENALALLQDVGSADEGGGPAVIKRPA